MGQPCWLSFWPIRLTNQNDDSYSLIGLTNQIDHIRLTDQNGQSEDCELRMRYTCHWHLWNIAAVARMSSYTDDDPRATIKLLWKVDFMCWPLLWLQVDFMRGAAVSRGGKAIIALPSRTSKGRPRIVPFLQEVRVPLTLHPWWYGSAGTERSLIYVICMIWMI